MPHSKNSRINIKQENFVSRMWCKYIPYWPVFLLLAFCIGSAWVYFSLATPVYESTAILLIKDKQKGKDDTQIIESLNQLSAKKIEKEMEIIKSRSLMIEVVKKLHLYAPVFEKESVKSVSAYTTSPIKIEVDKPDSLTEIDKVYFLFNENNSTVIFDQKLYPLNIWINTKYGTLRFTRNNATADINKCLYFSLVDPKNVAYNLLKRLDVAPEGKMSSVVKLKLKDEVPKRSEDILNKLIFAYDKADTNDKNALAANTPLIVKERLENAAHELDSIVRELHY
ncbi:MAG: Wzz/FepE/Etk N-terminal domain-containing protein [Chitinophagaceae bacterium]